MMPPDVTACSKLPPGAPCPTPDACICNREMDRHPPVLALVLITVGLLLSLFAVAAFFVGMYAVAASAFAADADQSCLTREQAKVKYPGQWLYWRTEHRCWYGKGKMEHVVNRGLKSATLVKKDVDASGNIVRARAMTPAEIDNLQYRDEAERRLRTCCWPVLPSFGPWHDRVDGNI